MRWLFVMIAVLFSLSASLSEVEAASTPPVQVAQGGASDVVARAQRSLATQSRRAELSAAESSLRLRQSRARAERRVTRATPGSFVDPLLFSRRRELQQELRQLRRARTEAGVARGQFGRERIIARLERQLDELEAERAARAAAGPDRRIRPRARLLGGVEDVALPTVTGSPETSAEARDFVNALLESRAGRRPDEDGPR